jgi:hypothetical protein
VTPARLGTGWSPVSLIAEGQGHGRFKIVDVGCPAYGLLALMATGGLMSGSGGFGPVRRVVSGDATKLR